MRKRLTMLLATLMLAGTAAVTVPQTATAVHFGEDGGAAATGNVECRPVDHTGYVTAGTRSHRTYYASSPVVREWTAGHHDFDRMCWNKYDNLWYRWAGSEEWIFALDLN